ncbi:hypothetical protein PR202_gb00484 [Eleusine coracana subsp. coracana]|uniref:TLDc domain-containing protein n=1 Tax=Eleusine coracana subsp. coracana TaxID=191504 RepID=A0AAV5DT79_ELECO|nr:hypothetical protein PR202_gb00484 [Eleusine coracana subsp. coracana]
MGNSQASTASASSSRFVTASRAFSKQELDGLRELFASLAAQSQTGGRAISRPVFLVSKRVSPPIASSWVLDPSRSGSGNLMRVAISVQEYYGIRGPLGERLFQLVAKESGGGDGVTFEDLIISKATYGRGTRDEVEEFIYQLCDVTGDGILSRSDLESVLASIHETIFAENKEAVEGSKNRAFEAFLNSAVFSKNAEGNSEKSMSLSDFRNWCVLMPSLRKFLGNLLMPPDSGRSGFQVPILHYPENISTDLLLLNKENTDAQTVLIVKDTEGSVYGGYASQPWERHSDFYGDMKTFLFKLYPQASIFRPTGANRNLQWCAINFSSDNIPNGIGFGGQPHHFGLFLSANFDQGHSFTCSTFTSPPLSQTNRFRPEVIECWGIQMRGAQDEKSEVVKGTVLERFKEDRNMLKLVGLASASD